MWKSTFFVKKYLVDDDIMGIYLKFSQFLNKPFSFI